MVRVCFVAAILVNVLAAAGCLLSTDTAKALMHVGVAMALLAVFREEIG